MKNVEWMKSTRRTTMRRQEKFDSKSCPVDFARPNRCVAEVLERRVLFTGALSFTSVQSPATGTTPWSIANADVNHDGILDLVACNEGGNSVSILLGNGNGTYGNQQSYAAGNAPYSVAASDLNSDGTPDLVVGDLGGVSVLWGNGNGTFQPPQTIRTGSGPASVAITSNNGNFDLIVANDLSNNVSVIRYNGKGSFAAPVTYATGKNPDSVTVADINGDGESDLLITNDTDGTLSLLLGNGDGTFQPQHTFASGGEPHAVAVANLNNDQKLDLVVTNFLDNTVSVLLNHGDGTFQSQQTFPTGSGPWGVAVADINGDGNPDLVVTNSGDNTAGILPGNGDGSFAPQQTFATGGTPHTVAISGGELLTANSGGNSISVLMENEIQDSPITPIFRQLHAPALAVAGVKAKTTASIALHNEGNTVHGSVVVSFYANTSQEFGGRMLLATVVRKNLTIRAGKAAVVNVGVAAFPATLPAGKYYLLAEVTDPLGQTNFVASSQTVQISAPFIQSQVTIGVVKPDELGAHKRGVVSVTVVNNGNIDAVGPLEITVNPSVDGSAPLSDFELASLARKLRIRTGKSATFRLRLRRPALLATGMYYPFASVTFAGIETTATNSSQFMVIS